MYVMTTAAIHDQLDLEKSTVKPNHEPPGERQVDVMLAVHRSDSAYSSNVTHLRLTADEARWLMDGLAAALLAPAPEPAEA